MADYETPPPTNTRRITVRYRFVGPGTPAPYVLSEGAEAMTPFARDLTEQLGWTLSGQVSLAAFRVWLAAASWNMHRTESAPTRRIVGSLELVFAEADLRHRTAYDVQTVMHECHRALIILKESVAS